MTSLRPMARSNEDINYNYRPACLACLGMASPAGMLKTQLKEMWNFFSSRDNSSARTDNKFVSANWIGFFYCNEKCYIFQMTLVRVSCVRL